MKKLINARIPVCLALSLIAGIAAGYLFVFYGVSLFWIIAVIPVAAIVFILCAVFCKKSKILIVIPLLAALFVTGGIVCGVRLLNYSSKTLADGQTYAISATVYETGESSYGDYIILKNVKADGKKVNGKLIAYLSEGYGNCDVGYKVNFTSSVSCYDLFPYGKLNHKELDNIKYSAKVDGSFSASYRFSLFGTIRSAIRNTLYDNSDGDTAAIAFAMLTGNTQGIEDSSMQTFRYGGIAHIFAVSGLHIGIAYGILTFFFKKLRLNKYVAAAICLSAIIFYAGICGFTVSSVRAVIMCAVHSVAKLFNQKQDSLNALAIAVILILLVSPTSLFSLGFQLSVCAVGGINLLSKQIARPLKKLPRCISSSVGVSLGAQFGTMPAMLVGLGYLSGAGLLLNIVIVPLLSVIFQVLFVSVTLCTILPFAAPYIIPYVTLPLQAVVSFLVGAGFEKALIGGFGAGLFGLFYFICIMAVSDKVNLKLLKRIAAIVCSVCLLCSYTLYRTYSTVHGYKIVASAYYGGGQVLIKGGGGNVLVLTENLNCSQTQKFINEYYSADLNAVIILGGEDCISVLNELNFDCGKVFVYEEYFTLQPDGNEKIEYVSEFELHGANYRFENGYSLMIECGGISVAVCAAEVPFERCDLLIASGGAGECFYASSACFNGAALEYDIYRTGAINYSAKDGKLDVWGIVRK